MPVPDDDGKWRLAAFKGKLRHSLAKRFVLRFHVSLILLFTIISGWGIDKVLYASGMETMLVRYLFAVFFAYAAFLLAVYVWIEFSGIREYLNQQKADELIGEKVPTEAESNFRDHTETVRDLTDLSVFIDGEGCLIVLGLAALFLALGGLMLLNPASFFSEIVVELLLAAGLLRGLNRLQSTGWMISAINATWWTFIFALTATVGICLIGQKMTPGAKTMHEVMHGSPRER